MKIGLDLDDTITEMPWFFALISKALINDGHEIHIITYREPEDREATIEELKVHRIKFSALHMPPDGVLPPEWKGKLAGELGLHLMIDDSPEILAAMPATTKRLWLCDREIFDLDVCIDAMRA